MDDLSSVQPVLTKEESAINEHSEPSSSIDTWTVLITLIQLIYKILSC